MLEGKQVQLKPTFCNHNLYLEWTRMGQLFSKCVIGNPNYLHLPRSEKKLFQTMFDFRLAVHFLQIFTDKPTLDSYYGKTSTFLTFFDLQHRQKATLSGNSSMSKECATFAVSFSILLFIRLGLPPHMTFLYIEVKTK